MIPEDTIREYGDLYSDWSDDIEVRFSRFRPNAKLKRFVSKIINKKTALILGAGLSSTTGPFNEKWVDYEDIYETLTTDPNQVEGFTSLYSYGGVKVKPKYGNDVIPDLVRLGLVASILTFNYNCHIEYCLSMCKIGYQSLIYNGEYQIEQITIGNPQCKIFKPHGSARITQNPTQIVWPERHPFSNLNVCERFVEDIKKNEVEQILIMGWSGNYDNHIRPYLEELFNLGVKIIHIGLPHHIATSVATVGWGVVDDFVCDFTDGAIDVLYGLAKVSGVTRPCIVNEDPLTRLSDNLMELGIENESIVLKGE